MISKRIFLISILIISVLIIFGLNYSYFLPVKDEVSEVSSTSVSKPVSKPVVSGSSSVSNKVLSNAPPKTYEFLGQKNLTATQIKSWYFSSNETKKYLKGFGYNCIYVKTDGGTSLTFVINPYEGSVTSIKEGDSCENDIFLEESLLEDIKNEGFSATKIRKYLEKVDMPTSMYFKAIKVFAVG